MKILRNYILKEFFGPFFIALVVLNLVMLLGNLIRLVDLIINKGVNILSVSKLFVLLIPSLVPYTLPIAVLVSILLSLGRLSSDNEIIAIRASGISTTRLIIIPLLLVGLILSLILLDFNNRIIPYAHFASRKTLVSIGIKNPTAVLEPGVFINSFEKYILFIYQIEGNRLEQVRIYEPRGENKGARTIVAKKGEFVPCLDKGMVKLKLIDGTSDEPDPRNPNNFYKLNFKTFFLTLNLNKKDSQEINRKPKDFSLKELRQEINKLNSLGIDTTPLIIEMHKRTSLAFSILVFVLLGSSLAMLTRRREKSINLSLAFLVVGIYYLLLLGANALALQGLASPSIAMWLPNIILGGVGLILTFKICAY